MYKGKSFAAIIPARGGSKRLPGKNSLTLAGKPLICWTIEAALKNRYIDEVVVSSDDDEIIRIAQESGAKTIKRPDELARDDTSTVDVLIDVLKQTAYNDYIVLLQPTSPLRTEKHIHEAIELLISKDADAVVSVCETEHSPLWSNVLPEDGSMDHFLREEIKNKRSQELPVYYRLNGAIYICKSVKLLEEHSLLLKHKSYAYVMSRTSSIDIDEAIDLEMAEFFMKKNQNSTKKDFEY